MLNTVDALAALLHGSWLEKHTLTPLTIAESEQIAFALQVEAANALAAWQLLRSHLQQTQRYPILSEGWGSDDFFARFYYQEEVSSGTLQNTSPESILAQVATADTDAFLAARQAASADYLEDAIPSALENTKAYCGTCPTESKIRELIADGTVCTELDLEKWLFNWELQNCEAKALTPLDTCHLDWFTPDNPTLLLLPIDQGWQSLAYLHWYGACSVGTPIASRFLQKWHQQYHAELVCHYGTMLQLQVGKRPASPAAAFELAWQQVALAECTILLPGVSLRDQARALLNLDRWFLHERP
ncbi:DUF4253 domain-containing protein [Almyronema epifaneia]|uniref:DUF4253 domain-containing protein n=1 Tax=Almyronema epifaneia S1 TaxID=2991925 RepID=A0ABW6IA82_9CYAN